MAAISGSGDAGDDHFRRRTHCWHPLHRGATHVKKLSTIRTLAAGTYEHAWLRPTKHRQGDIAGLCDRCRHKHKDSHPPPPPAAAAVPALAATSATPDAAPLPLQPSTVPTTASASLTALTPIPLPAFSQSTAVINLTGDDDAPIAANDDEPTTARLAPFRPLPSTLSLATNLATAAAATTFASSLAAPFRGDPTPSQSTAALQPFGFLPRLPVKHFSFSERPENDRAIVAREPFIVQPAVLAELYGNQSAPHAGLTLWTPSARDWPTTAAFGLSPAHIAELKSDRAVSYLMRVVPFDLESYSRTVKGRRSVTGEQVELDVLQRVKESVASRKSSRKAVEVAYQRDNEDFQGWQKLQKNKSPDEQQLVMSAFNPTRFARHSYNLISLMPYFDFPGFARSSWYWKQPGSFFCLHVEQLYAPFYNVCYVGSTTWFAVQRVDFVRLREYVVKRALKYYGVEWEWLTPDDRAAAWGLLYTKKCMFHPSDLVACGIHVTLVRQDAGTILVGDGDVVHFGITTRPPPSFNQPLKSAISVNEAVNFMPLEWLWTGLPAVLDWLRWFRDTWLPIHNDDRMADARLAELRTIMREFWVNEAVLQHCPPHYCRSLMVKLTRVLAPESEDVGSDAGGSSSSSGGSGGGGGQAEGSGGGRVESGGHSGKEERSEAASAHRGAQEEEKKEGKEELKSTEAEELACKQALDQRLMRAEDGGVRLRARVREMVRSVLELLDDPQLKPQLLAYSPYTMKKGQKEVTLVAKDYIDY